MLDLQSWQHLTAGVSMGRKLRAAHDCGSGNTMIVSNKPEGYSAWCFRCSDHGFIPHPAPSLQERLAALAAVRSAEDAATESLTLPTPQEFNPQEWPDQPRVWLYKAGLSNDDITQLGFYYCARLERVVMPLYREGRLVYWQARGFRKERAKYINPPVDRATLCAQFQGRQHQTVLVLTEDILSAYRVARLTSAWAVMGTELPDAVALEIASLKVPVVLMLDPDAGGLKGNARISRKLRDIGVDVAVARPPRDPKYLTVEGIRSCVVSAAPHTQPLLLPCSQAALLPTLVLP